MSEDEDAKKTPEQERRERAIAVRAQLSEFIDNNELHEQMIVIGTRHLCKRMVELVNGGFTREEAMQIIIHRGLQ